MDIAVMGASGDVGRAIAARLLGAIDRGEVSKHLEVLLDWSTRRR